MDDKSTAAFEPLSYTVASRGLLENLLRIYFSTTTVILSCSELDHCIWKYSRLCHYLEKPSQIPQSQLIPPIWSLACFACACVSTLVCCKHHKPLGGAVRSRECQCVQSCVSMRVWSCGHVVCLCVWSCACERLGKGACARMCACRTSQFLCQAAQDSGGVPVFRWAKSVLTRHSWTQTQHVWELLESILQTETTLRIWGRLRHRNTHFHTSLSAPWINWTPFCITL